MLITLTIAGTTSIPVWQFAMEGTPPAPTKIPYSLPPGSVIVCEDTELVTGNSVYLQPYGLFFVQSVPSAPGNHPPTKPCLFSTGAQAVSASASTSGPNVVNRTLAQPAPCRLLVISNDEPTLLSSTSDVTLPKDTRVAVNASDLTTDSNGERINAQAVFIVDQGSGVPQGPYIFTDNDIPVNVLTDEVEIPRT